MRDIPLFVESDIEEIKTDGGQYLLAFRIPRAQYDLRPIHLTLTPFGHTYKRRDDQPLSILYSCFAFVATFVACTIQS